MTAPELPGAESVTLNGILSSQGTLSFVSSPNTLRVTWEEFQDYESGITNYNVIITNLNSGLIIHSETVDGMEREWTRNSFQFRDGDLISVTVEGVNGAGGSGMVSLPMVMVDLTPPVLTNIVDGRDLIDLDYQDSGSSLAASWSVQDLQSGIISIGASIYEVREGRKVRFHPALQANFVSIPTNQNTWVVDGLRLTSGARYVISLMFTNGAGLEATYETNGVLVDSTPPTVASVLVLSDVYLDTADTGDAVSVVTDSVTMVANPNLTEARWSAFDTESGLLHFLVGVVDAVNNNTLVSSEYTVFEGTAIGGIVQISSELSPEGVYRVVVIAVNRAGTESEDTFSAPFR